MDRQLELGIADDLLAELANPSSEIAESIYEEPVENYYSDSRDRAERDVLFGRTPLMAALSGELPTVGSWKLFDEAGWPILLVRGKDEVVRGFLNVCSHRGARVVEEPRGEAKRLSCPFHAWAYGLDGSLSGVPAKQAFTGICQQERGLRPVQVREHLGAIWVVCDPDAPPMDVAAHLGPFAEELGLWNMGNWHFGKQLVHRVSANWKLTMDTFTESYHVPVLHKASIGDVIPGSTAVFRSFGDHHRLVFPTKMINELRDRPRDSWQPFDNWQMLLTYVVYPNVTFMVTGSHAEMYQTFPGVNVDESVCLHSVFGYEPIETDDDRASYAQRLQYFFDFVDAEDFRVCAGAQKGIRSGAVRSFVFGRNEAGTQYLHRSYQRDLDRHAGRTRTPPTVIDEQSLAS
jgi:phenylpropionate dioxygenase-like ring-hydroxylating dioxygenase large terminal subunit